MTEVVENIEVKKYDSYKDSGEYWMGDLPEHWEVKKLKHIFSEKKKVTNQSLQAGSISFGKVVFKDDEKIPESTKASYQEVLSGEYLVNPLNLNYDLVSLRIGLSDIDVVVSSGYIVLKNCEEINKSYFKWLLHRYDVANMKLLGSGVRQTISFNHIANSLLAFPPLAEQNQIASFLDKKTLQVDQAIDKKEQLIELLKERKQIMIHKAVTQGLDLKAKMKDSGVEWIGELPKHWTVLRAKFIFDEIDNRSETGNEELLSVSHMTGVTPRSEKNIYMFMAEDYAGSKLCNNGDLVINIMWAWMGALGVSNQTGIVSPSYGVFRQKVKLMSSWYLEHLLRDPEYVAEYNRRSTGLHSSRLRLYANYFFEMTLGFPPLEEQRKIEKHVTNQTDKIDSAIVRTEQEIEKLKEYKSTLINSAVTGKIKV